jgi:hypothetical protein
MARDYYPLLARAIGGLEEKTAEARRTVYDHARAALVRHMRDLDADLATGFGELRALEEAILKIESEAAGTEESKPVSVDESPNIAERAYLLWEQAGRPEGKALEHWLLAEAERSTEPSAEIPGTPDDPGTHDTGTPNDRRKHGRDR